MATRVFTQNEALDVEKSTFGVKATALHYTRLAKDAGDRMRTAVQADKVYMIVQEAQVMYENLKAAQYILSDDENVFEGETSETAK